MAHWIKNTILIGFVTILSGSFAFAQKTPVKKDSVRMYKKIATYSERNKFNRFIYKLVFKPITNKVRKNDAIKKKYKNKIQRPYSSFEGKTIRQINIVTLDPFGYSIHDTLHPANNFLIATGNRMHIKSRVITIRNLLLIHKNQPFDSLLVKESERLVRSRQYVRDVSFFVTNTSRNSDSVDIYIRVLDNWSIIPELSASPSSVTMKLSDKNFLGTGHESKNGFTWFPQNSENAYNTKYSIPNIRNSYISAAVYYGADEFRSFIKSLDINRPFFSPYAKWAAGVSIVQQFHRDSVWNFDSEYVEQRLKYNVQDYWAGSAIRIFKGNSENKRTTNFISTLGYTRIQYLEKPPDNPGFSDEHLYLAGFSVSTRKYLQDRYIFRYGVTEDIPTGKVFSLTTGFQKKNIASRYYLGARISWGNYFTWGYLSTSVEWSAFLHRSATEQGVFSTDMNYFTALKSTGKWKFRHFIKSQMTIGIHRFAEDSLTLKDGYGLDGFNSSGLSGSNRFLFTLQTQTYSPWNLLGFRFGPYLVCSVGMLGDARNGFRKSRVYSQIGLGVLIKNESLVINTFQVSISYFPIIPGKGDDIFKFNSFRTTDFGFKDFQVGKPGVSVFQ